MEIEERHDREDLGRLVVEWAWLVDHGHADRVWELFTETGSLTLSDRDLRGTAAIKKWGQERAAMTERTSRHLCTNLRFEVDGQGNASGSTVVMVFRWDGLDQGVARAVTPVTVGEFEDEFIRDETGRWRFTSRKTRVAATVLRR